jgi:hypothetical protein
MPRLLACYDCSVLSKLPDYEGHPSMDMALIEVCKMHEHNDIPDRAKKGGQLFGVDTETYDKLDPVTVINKELAKAEVQMHDFRDELKEEAMKCFNAHGRPGEGDGCPDFESEAKTIGRKAGIPKDKRMFLCHFCPFTHGVVVVENRRKKGMYK